MIPIDKDTCMAILRLRGNNDWNAFVSWIRKSANKQSLDNNHTREEWLLRQNQGRNLELLEQIEHIDKAEEKYKRLSEPQKSNV